MSLKLDSVSTLLNEPDAAPVHSVTLFVALVSACIVIGHLLQKTRWMNQSVTALAFGLCTATVIILTTNGKISDILLFDEDLFFICLLPPIIFNAGFQVKKKQFFQNFIIINLFGVVGTLISFGIISIGISQSQGLLCYFLFGNKILIIIFMCWWSCPGFACYLARSLGAILSATDTVCTLQVLNQEDTPLLYSLVFGEGVVNDATSIVLFNAIQKFSVHVTPDTVMQFTGSFLYLFSLSTLLGIAVGLMSAYIIRKLYFGRHSTDREVALMILMAYLSYVMADLFQLSGILTVFFCGIVMSHYTWHNITESSRVTTKHTFATLSFISETFIFLYVGMDALDMEKWKIVKGSPGTSVAVSSTLLGLVLVGRAASVFSVSFLSNLANDSPIDKIGFKQQVTIWWAGLMRGAVSVALAYNKFTSSGHTQRPKNAIMITSTITIVLFSNVVFGLLTKPLVRLMLQPREESSEISSPKSSSALLPLLANGQDLASELDSVGGGISIRRPSSLTMLITKPTSTVHYYWRKFDNAVMRPIFGGGGEESPPNDILH
ncbi:Sodium/hydrogen exchanger [Citrus sinensis]|uniref:Sodium/hydrogen exchanger n=1 Tax=Citrus sinensis TaxID=2711 RepID=A0ACB8MKL1_CITSI|nr:Sodium/hydrogen exchanger [Citrus sinensis]